MPTVRFTPNDTVLVKLTEAGKRRAIAEFDKTCDAVRQRGSMWRPEFPYKDGGFMRGQFWAVCDLVGGYTGTAGQDILFEWIEVESKEPQA